MAASDDGDRASGDASVTKITPPTPPDEPEAPKVLDVELIVDGFGFMPKTIQTDEKRTSNVFDQSSKVIKDIMLTEPEEGRSPCASSTNIDIVRRYTWKTKNRMTVQVRLVLLYPGQSSLINSLSINALAIQVITYGATITGIQVPDRKGVPDDVVAGFDSLEGKTVANSNINQVPINLFRLS